MIQIFLEDFRALGEDFRQLSAEDIYYYINHVGNSPIRIESDELHYHLHVLIRFEIEVALANREIEVNDIPQLWNQKYKEYLGIEIKNDAEGCLQDCHRSLGSFGYFPTYSLGTTLSAIWKEMIEEELGDLGKLFETKEGMLCIREWLKEHVHQY